MKATECGPPAPKDSSGPLKAYIAIISGRVQGVGFRWFTVQEASKCAIVGHVRNLLDGRVEVLLQGDEVDLEALLGRLRQGPSASQVVELDLRAVPVDRRRHTFEVQY